MDKYNLLDCTLRDGGYITDWKFPDPMIRDVIQTLAFANLDFVEVGYLCDNPNRVNSTQFSSAEQLSEFLPQNRRRCKFLAMADVAQILPDAIAPHSEKSVDGIRVVFYKHQIAEALVLSKRIKEQGYQLFVQPMVTIDYTLDEFVQLTKQLADIEPDAISIVDSFGYMRKDDFRKYFKVVDNVMAPDTTIGFHLHNNMNLAFSTAQDIMEYDTHRRLIIDASLYGMGRGAGNLNTELIANHYNYMFGIKYNIKFTNS